MSRRFLNFSDPHLQNLVEHGQSYHTTKRKSNFSKLPPSCSLFFLLLCFSFFFLSITQMSIIARLYAIGWSGLLKIMLAAVVCVLEACFRVLLYCLPSPLVHLFSVELNKIFPCAYICVLCVRVCVCACFALCMYVLDL